MCLLSVFLDGLVLFLPATLEGRVLVRISFQLLLHPHHRCFHYFLVDLIVLNGRCMAQKKVLL